MSRPRPGDYPAYFERYLSLVPDGDIETTLEARIVVTVDLFSRVAPEREGYRYAAGKWSVRESLGHIIDTERIFSCRALRVARGDQTPLTSFDQDLFVAGADFDHYPLADLIAEMAIVRRSTIALFRHLAPQSLDRHAPFADSRLTARAAAWIIAGHEIYHQAILRDRYSAALT